MTSQTAICAELTLTAVARTAPGLSVSDHSRPSRPPALRHSGASSSSPTRLPHHPAPPRRALSVGSALSFAFETVFNCDCRPPADVV